MDAIGLESWTRTEIADTYIHIEYPYGDHTSRNPALDDAVVAICGWSAYGDNILWYDGLGKVDCPVCLKIVAVAKRSVVIQLRILIAKQTVQFHLSFGFLGRIWLFEYSVDVIAV